MIFLVDGDLTPQIRTEVLTVVRGTEETQETLELAAIAEMQSYLAGRFDVALIFGSTGTNRNAQIVMYCVDILLYHLHSRCTPRNIPEIRKIRYDAAIKWLELVASDKLNPGLPVIPGEESGEYKLGSNKKVSNRW